MPFRSAYKTVGQIVHDCIERKITLDEMPLEEYKKASDLFDEELYTEISLEVCVAKRISEGGTGYESVSKQIKYVETFLEGYKI